MSETAFWPRVEAVSFFFIVLLDTFVGEILINSEIVMDLLRWIFLKITLTLLSDSFLGRPGGLAGLVRPSFLYLFNAPYMQWYDLFICSAFLVVVCPFSCKEINAAISSEDKLGPFMISGSLVEVEVDGYVIYMYGDQLMSMMVLGVNSESFRQVS